MDKLTAAEFAAIGERVKDHAEWCRLHKAGIAIQFSDRAVLHATLEGLIERGIEMYGDQFLDVVDGVYYPTKDDAIDALLGGGK